MQDDPYKTLSIPITATKEQIKQAYKRLVKIYHPDINKDGEKHMKKINNAYEMLMKQKPKEYIQIQYRYYYYSGTATSTNWNYTI